MKKEVEIQILILLQKEFHPILRKLMTKEKKNRSRKNLCFSHRYTARRTQLVLLIEQVQ